MFSTEREYFIIIMDCDHMCVCVMDLEISANILAEFFFFRLDLLLNFTCKMIEVI